MRNLFVPLAVTAVIGVFAYSSITHWLWTPEGRAVVVTSPDLGSDSSTSGGSHRSWEGGFAGVGWSINPDTSIATEQAFSHAMVSEEQASDITFVYYNPSHDPEQIVQTLRKGPKPVGRIFGETTHEGILTSEGYHTSPTGVLGLMTMHYPNISVGVGIANFESHSPAEAARHALAAAKKDAGSAMAGRKPAVVILNVTLPNEEAVLDALSSELGPDIPVIGGTAAGSVDNLSRKKISNWSIIVNDTIVHHGVGIAVVYTEDSLALAYGGGYRRTSISGTVTKSKPRLILEIDGKPAVDVYNEWLGGRLEEAIARGENAAKFCGLYPICRVAGDNSQFIRAWPSDDPQFPGSLRTGSNLNEGDEIFLSEGNWNMLVNHFGSIPNMANESFEKFDAGSALLFYCGGALACIPDYARDQMNVLVNHSMGEIPWIGVFTWGEQGHIPGIGNVHSNLSAGTVLFPTVTPE